MGVVAAQLARQAVARTAGPSARCEWRDDLHRRRATAAAAAAGDADGGGAATLAAAPESTPTEQRRRCASLFRLRRD